MLSFPRRKELFTLAIHFANAAQNHMEERLESLSEELLDTITDQIGDDVFDMLNLPDDLPAFAAQLSDNKTTFSFPDRQAKIFSGVDETIELDTLKYIESNMGFIGSETIAKMLKAFHQQQEAPEGFVSSNDKTAQNYNDLMKMGYPELASFFQPA